MAGAGNTTERQGRRPGVLSGVWPRFGTVDYGRLRSSAALDVDVADCTQTNIMPATVGGVGAGRE